MIVDDELVGRRNVWEFYYFAAATVVPLLEDFLDVAEFKAEKGCPRFFRELPENAIGSEDFENIRGNYTNKEGKSPIIIRIAINREYERINSTLSIEPELWDAKAGRAITPGFPPDVQPLIHVKVHGSFISAQKRQNIPCLYEQFTPK